MQGGRHITSSLNASWQNPAGNGQLGLWSPDIMLQKPLWLQGRTETLSKRITSRTLWEASVSQSIPTAREHRRNLYIIG